jgi:xanthine dehydrogenase iron-sulfur cluster and FAD-binding subunit A
MRLVSAAGERIVSYADFHLGYKKLEMNASELLWKIELPRRGFGWQYFGRKVGTRRAQAISKCSIALAVKLDSGVIAEARLALGSVAPVPMRCVKTEVVLRGRRLSAAAIEHACETLHTEIAPIDDLRSTAAYRARVAANLLAYFLTNLHDAR